MLGVLCGPRTARVLETLVFAQMPLHLREIARRCGLQPIEVSRLLDKYCKAKIVVREKMGNLVLFSLNRSSQEGRLLENLVEKTRGVIPSLSEALGGEKKIKLAFVDGSCAAQEEGVKSDIDLLVVASLEWPSVAGLVTGVESNCGREINYIVYSPEEFERKKKTPFLSRVLRGKKIMLVGNLEDKDTNA